MAQPDEVSFSSDDLRLVGYLYRPTGTAPFPVVVHHAGTREHQEHVPIVELMRGRSLFAPRGYLDFWPERRGYGHSQGEGYFAAIGWHEKRPFDEEQNRRFHRRIDEEVSDVIASIDYVRSLPEADSQRIIILALSVGAVAALLAAPQIPGLAAIVAGGTASYVWDKNATLRARLLDAMADVTAPILFIHSSTENIRPVLALSEELARHGKSFEVKIYLSHVPDDHFGTGIVGGRNRMTNELTSFIDCVTSGVQQ